MTATELVSRFPEKRFSGLFISALSINIAWSFFTSSTSLVLLMPAPQRACSGCRYRVRMQRQEGGSGKCGEAEGSPDESGSGQTEGVVRRWLGRDTAVNPWSCGPESTGETAGRLASVSLRASTAGMLARIPSLRGESVSSDRQPSGTGREHAQRLDSFGWRRLTLMLLPIHLYRVPPPLPHHRTLIRADGRRCNGHRDN